MKKYHKYCLLILLGATVCCKKAVKTVNNEKRLEIVADSLKIFTAPSTLQNTYVGFDSPKAINKVAAIENEYFKSIGDSYSTYYGTVWRTIAESIFLKEDSINLFRRYQKELEKRGVKADSMHCTIYAIESLKEGLGTEFEKLETIHRKIWKKREYAGWSVAHILTEKMGWKAYLFISKRSEEYEACIANYKKDREYKVWKQPNIKIERLFDFDEEKPAIDSLLRTNEYGWGFSEQGWHTWITRFRKLKECNWLGAPSKAYMLSGEKPLFLTTDFTEFQDYDSHIIVFPPKKEN